MPVHSESRLPLKKILNIRSVIIMKNVKKDQKKLWVVSPRGFANEFYLDYATSEQIASEREYYESRGNYNFIADVTSVQQINRDKGLHEELLRMMRNFNYQFYDDCRHGYIDKWNIINAIECRENFLLENC